MPAVVKRALELGDEDAQVRVLRAWVHLRDEQDPHGARKLDVFGAIKKRMGRRIILPVTMREPVSLENIEALYRARLGAFRRVARAILGDPEAARDAVQDAFASAVRSRATFRGDGSLEGWIWRTVVNAARMQLRGNAARPTSPLGEETAANGHAQPDTRLRAAVAALPERQRLVLFLRYYADLDYAAIAETLEISPGTVAATLNSARSSLRSVLEEVPR
jgi:RNA polymerase sigma-70 factor (ECF subfamily)